MAQTIRIEEAVGKRSQRAAQTVPRAPESDVALLLVSLGVMLDETPMVVAKTATAGRSSDDNAP
jgi:hypothetical protein